jgi:hypothetical protein
MLRLRGRHHFRVAVSRALVSLSKLTTLLGQKAPTRSSRGVGIVRRKHPPAYLPLLATIAVPLVNPTRGEFLLSGAAISTAATERRQSR